ncbi:MAG: DUF350 domain-containing protein [Labilithrix sp.]|nr:DUF350 domain-containing protein [Labilithrix sp.]MCW5815039.1 DUF350 domain-containing protein [Labilithrix sp.]
MDDVDVKPLYLVSFGAATTLLMLVAALIARRSLAAELTKGNSAQRLFAVGQVSAIFLVAANAVKSSVEGESILHDATWVGAFGLAGVVLIAVTGRLGVGLLLHSRLPAEIERGNVAAGLAGGAHYVATGIITSHAMAGNDVGTLGISVVFFVLGQITLHVFVSLFRALTTYDDAEQIAGENLAAALSYAGAAIAIAIIIARAAEGDFTGWSASLKGYAGVIACVVALYPVRQVFVQMLLLRAPLKLRGGPIDEGISVERSAGLGALEAVTYIATALSITRLA